MSSTVEVDGFRFELPKGWQVSRYDDWAFYRKRFSAMWDGIKAVDLLAIAPDATLWLVEVKDYRANPRTKPSELDDEVARKVFDTLAAMLPASVGASDGEEQDFSRAALRSGPNKRLRVALHLEQPKQHSKLFPRAIDPADVEQRLRRLLKPIDPHPMVTESARNGRAPWHTEPIARPV